MHKNYHIDVAPTELKRPFEEKNSYTVRMPLMTLEGCSEALLDSLFDTANVAFSHNEPGKRDIYVSAPAKTRRWLKTMTDYFASRGMKVHMVESDDTEFVDFTVVKKLEWTCVDRRLDDNGAKVANEDGFFEGQITHPGAIAFLHPRIAEVTPPHHLKYLQDIMNQIMINRWKIKDIVLHAGVDGAPGCGGMGVANRAGAGIDTIEKHLHLVRDIRDSYKDAMDPGCKITAQLVDPDNNVVSLDTDDAGEFQELIRTKLNV